MDGKWTNKDWKWLVGILIGIMILMIASFFNSKIIETNFSIISSAVSIALALVAIFIALKQDSDNQRVNQSVSSLLNEIARNIAAVDEKVRKIDETVLNDVKAEVVEEFEQKNPDKKTYTADEVNNIVKTVTDELTKNFYESLNNEEKERTSREIRILSAIYKNKDKSVTEIQEILANEYKLKLSLAAISRYMNKTK